MSFVSVLQARLGDQPLFTFHVPGAAPLRVVRFGGREGLSQLFEFRIDRPTTSTSETTPCR